MKIRQMRYLSILFALLIVGCNQESNHRSELKLNASPVVGDVGMRSARVWCQLASGNQLEKPYVYLLDSADQRMVATPMESAQLGGCFQLQLSDLSPGTRYRYFIGDEHGTPLSEMLPIRTQPLWQYRTDPPELNFLLGSCTYINEPEYDRPGEPYVVGMGYLIQWP